MKRIIAVLSALIMCLCLSSCKASDYKKGIELQESKDYVAAASIFEQLADYKDSTERLSSCKEMIDATDLFNNAAAELNNKNSVLEEKVATAESILLSEDKALDESLRPELETAISDVKAAKTDVPEIPLTAEEITNLANDLSAVDYSDVLAALDEKQTSLEISIKKYALVNNPSEAYVINCLKTVPGIMDISAATEENDPNGNLHKAGGYTSAVYFSHENVNQSSVYGNTIIEKGTDCGGQIEVYASEDDANKRNNYLAGFDGTAFASGSHVVIGTVIVRTSDELTASQQKELENNIILALTKVE